MSSHCVITKIVSSHRVTKSDVTHITQIVKKKFLSPCYTRNWITLFQRKSAEAEKIVYIVDIKSYHLARQDIGHTQVPNLDHQNPEQSYFKYLEVRQVGRQAPNRAPKFSLSILIQIINTSTLKFLSYILK